MTHWITILLTCISFSLQLFGSMLQAANSRNQSFMLLWASPVSQSCVGKIRLASTWNCSIRNNWLQPLQYGLMHHFKSLSVAKPTSLHEQQLLHVSRICVL